MGHLFQDSALFVRERANSGGAFTNTAQHSRYVAGSIFDSFRLNVHYEDWINDRSITTTYQSKDGKEITTADLVPGKPSRVVTRLGPLTSRPSSEVWTYLTIGLSIDGAPPVDIGQSKQSVKTTYPTDARTTIFTPDSAKGHTVGELVWVLKELGTNRILDIETETWPIDNSLYKAIPIDSLYYLLLLHEVISEEEEE